MTSNVPVIIDETDDVLVIAKPAGLIVHSDGRTHEPSVADWILENYPALAKVGESWTSPQGEVVPLPGIVHRLDRTTSGVMLVAKTPEAFTHFKNEFKARRVEKLYCAFVYGHMDTEEGEIVAEIMRSSTPPRRWYARPCDPDDARAAITRWRCVKNFSDPATSEAVSYVEATPLTGRTHQIRVHFASINRPLVADHLYASDRAPLLGFTRPALHARSISLTKQDGERATYSAPFPDDFAQILSNIV